MEADEPAVNVYNLVKVFGVQMHQKPDPEEVEAPYDCLTFPVYSSAEPWGFDGLELPTEHVNLDNQAKESVLLLVEKATENLGTAGDGQVVAHVYVHRDTYAVMGFDLMEQFSPYRG